MQVLKSDQEKRTFEGLDLSCEEIKDIDFTECLFKNCIFENCELERCRFTDCSFSGCRVINLRAERTTMLDSTFRQCYLTGINWSQLQFSAGYISPIEYMDDCQLKYNNFVEANFSKFNFSNNSITASLFADCKLIESKFINCNLDGTEFFRCDLTKADFRNSTDYVIDLETNKLKGARFSFPEVINLLNGLGIVID